MKKIVVKPPFIKLDSFLKFCGVSDTGGQVKLVIEDGGVLVNGEVCTMRGKKLRGGEVVTFSPTGEEFSVEMQ